jgi:hypothetical protein
MGSARKESEVLHSLAHVENIEVRVALTPH